MKLSRSLLLLAACSSVSAIQWGSKNHLATNNELIETASPPSENTEFEPAVLLAPTPRNPKLYYEATLELTRLKQKPICHRVAAQLLMDSCKGLDDIDAKSYHYNRAELQQVRVESFAAALTMCDLERADFIIPDACYPFTSGVLYNAYQSGTKFQYSAERSGDCLKVLKNDHSTWATWISYRDSALLFCRAAGVELSKDQSINTHQRLVEILELFAKDLAGELKGLKETVASGSESVDSAFQKILQDTDRLKTRLHDATETVAEELEGATSKLKFILDLGKKTHDIMDRFQQTMIRGNAEIMAKQRSEMELTNGQVSAGLQDVNEKLADSEHRSKVMAQFMLSIQHSLNAIAERQDTIEKQSNSIFTSLINATEILQGHSQELQKASDAASDIHEDLQKASEASRNFLVSLGAEGWVADFLITAATSVMALVLGSYGLAPSLQRNVGLLIGGSTVAQLGLFYRGHCRESWLFSFIDGSPDTPSTPTQFASSAKFSRILKNEPNKSSLNLNWELTENSHLEMVRDVGLDS